MSLLVDNRSWRVHVTAAAAAAACTMMRRVIVRFSKVRGVTEARIG